MEKTIYIVGFEAKDGISFWDWYLNKKAQENRITYLTGRTGIEKLSGSLYYGEVQLENAQDERDINGLVELWLEENDWENSFPENKNIIL